MGASLDPPTTAAVPAEATKTTDPTTAAQATAPSSERSEAIGETGPSKLDTTTKPSEAQTKAPVPPTTAQTTSSPTDINTNIKTNGAGVTSSASATTGLPSQDDTNPLDFQGDVQTNNNLPSEETIRKLEKYTVLDQDGKSHTFKSLYTGPNVARRVLIIFIRHFFCGMCQEYLRVLSATITPTALLQLPVPTSIAVIGCGDPKLIAAYLAQTGCPFPVYADNTQHLYRELGMIRTLAAGDRPAYMRDRTMAQTIASGIAQALRQAKSGLMLKMGDQKQVGGEFLFEPASQSVESPIATPRDETKSGGILEDGPGSVGGSRTSREDGDDGLEKEVEEKKVTWCHRMRNTRDHVEIPELRDVLGLEPEGDGNGDGAGAGAKHAEGGGKGGERWARALRSRKGTGLSMASQMSRMSIEAKGLPSEGVAER